MNDYDRRKWEPHRGLVLIILALGWVAISLVTVLKDKPAPAFPMLPFSPAPSTNSPGVPSTMRARAPLVDEGPPAPEFGVMAVAPGSDRCFGKPCRVSSLTVTPGVAFASLPSCGAALIGQIRLTTDQGYVYCDGVATWTPLGSATSEPLTVSSPLTIYDDGGTVNLSISVVSEALWSAGCDACTTDLNFIGPLANPPGTSVGRIQCSWETAGTVGSTNATIQVYNVTDSSSVCTCAIGACNNTARTPMDCTCGGTLTTGKNYAMRLSGKGDCSVAPQTILCTGHISP